MASLALEEKINKIRLKNEEIKRRHEEVEADKKNAAKLDALIAPIPPEDWPERREPPEFANPAPKPRGNPKNMNRKHNDQTPQYYPGSGEGKKTLAFADGQGPPPDPKYNFLADSERDENAAEIPSSSERNRGRNKNSRGGFRRRGSGRDWHAKEHWNQHENPGDMTHTEYEAWRAERNRIDEARISRQRTAEGNWRREWDNDKIHMADDVSKRENRVSLADIATRQESFENDKFYRSPRAITRNFQQMNAREPHHSFGTNEPMKNQATVSEADKRFVIATDKSIKVLVNAQQGSVPAKSSMMSVKVCSSNIAGTGRVGPRQRPRITYSAQSEVDPSIPEVSTFARQKSNEENSKSRNFEQTSKGTPKSLHHLRKSDGKQGHPGRKDTDDAPAKSSRKDSQKSSNSHKNANYPAKSPRAQRKSIDVEKNDVATTLEPQYGNRMDDDAKKAQEVSKIKNDPNFTSNPEENISEEDATGSEQIFDMENNVNVSNNPEVNISDNDTTGSQQNPEIENYDHFASHSEENISKEDTTGVQRIPDVEENVNISSDLGKNISEEDTIGSQQMPEIENCINFSSHPEENISEKGATGSEQISEINDYIHFASNSEENISETHIIGSKNIANVENDVNFPSNREENISEEEIASKKMSKIENNIHNARNSEETISDANAIILVTSNTEDSTNVSSSPNISSIEYQKPEELSSSVDTKDIENSHSEAETDQESSEKNPEIVKLIDATSTQIAKPEVLNDSEEQSVFTPLEICTRENSKQEKKTESADSDEGNISIGDIPDAQATNLNGTIELVNNDSGFMEPANNESFHDASEDVKIVEFTEKSAQSEMVNNLNEEHCSVIDNQEIQSKIGTDNEKVEIFESTSKDQEIARNLQSELSAKVDNDLQDTKNRHDKTTATNSEKDEAVITIKCNEKTENISNDESPIVEKSAENNEKSTEANEIIAKAENSHERNEGCDQTET